MHKLSLISKATTYNINSNATVILAQLMANYAYKTHPRDSTPIMASIGVPGAETDRYNAHATQRHVSSHAIQTTMCGLMQNGGIFSSTLLKNMRLQF